MNSLNRLAAILLACALALPASAADMNQVCWSETAGSNTCTPPHGFPENQLPSTVNDSAREMAGALKRWHDQMTPTVTSGGAANVQTLAYAVAPTAYVAGDTFTFKAGFSNSSATTLNVNSLGAKAVQLAGAALTGGEIVSGRAVTVWYDGTQFQIGSYAVGAVSQRLAIGWPAAIDPSLNIIGTVDQASTVQSIVGTVATAVGATATASVYKAPSGTACGSGTVLHSGSFNANGTAATNQTLTLTTTALSAGDRICLVTANGSNWTAGVGVGGITVRLTTP